MCVDRPPVASTEHSQIVSFSANKKTSALTMTVAANVKQVLTILLAVVIFNLHVRLVEQKRR